MSNAFRLSRIELAVAAHVGCIREIASLTRQQAHGSTNLWSDHVLGVCGEMVVCKLLGVYWEPTVNTFKAPDIGNRMQVRTRRRHSYDLLVRDDDPDDDVFVLVTGGPRDFVVRGWLDGETAKQERWRQAHGNREPAFFVPQQWLRDIESLVALAP